MEDVEIKGVEEGEGEALICCHFHAPVKIVSVPVKSLQWVCDRKRLLDAKALRKAHTQYESVTPQEGGKRNWSDNIILSQDTQVSKGFVALRSVLQSSKRYGSSQESLGCSKYRPPYCIHTLLSSRPTKLHPALIYKYVPIIGPIFGSAFIIGLYMLSRLVKGDLTDRMNMMSQVWQTHCWFALTLKGILSCCCLEHVRSKVQAPVAGCEQQHARMHEEQRRKQQQLKEVRVAFLEEELPALVAKRVSLGETVLLCIGSLDSLSWRGASGVGICTALCVLRRDSGAFHWVTQFIILRGASGVCICTALCVLVTQRCLPLGHSIHDFGEGHREYVSAQHCVFRRATGRLLLSNECPVLLADEVRKKAANINKKLGSKLEIPDSEVGWDFCHVLGGVHCLHEQFSMWLGRVGQSSSDILVNK
eukprot:1162005-Pelagomonas_calceolata.AAC.8